MQKWKRPLYFLLTLIVLGALLWGTHQFYPLPFVKVSSFRAVPKYASFVFNPVSFRESPSPWEAWDLSGHWALLQQVETVLDDTTARRPPIRRAVAVLQPMGKGQMGWLGIWEVKRAPKKLDTWLQRYPVLESRFKQVRLYSGKTSEGQAFAIARFRNLILAAPFPFLIEDAIRQLKRFSSERSALAKKARSLSLQPGQIPLQWTPVLSEEGRSLWSFFRNWKCWAALEVETDSLGWQAVGEWKTGEDLDLDWPGMLTSFTPAYPDSIFSVLPEQLLTFFWAPPSAGDWWEKGAARRFLKPWWSGEWAVGLLPGYGLDAQIPLFWVGKIRSQKAFDAWLEQWSSEQGELSAHTYQTFQIRQILAEPLLPLPWSEDPLPLNNPYITQIEDFLVITDSKPSLEVWLDQYISGQVLGRADHFLEGRTLLPSKASAWGYIQADRFGPLLSKSFQPEQQLPFLEQGQLQMALFPGEDHLEIQVVKREQEVFSSAVSIAWKANLDAPAIMSPQPVFGGPERSWIVQDDQFDLYRIAPGGTVQWKRRLEDRVLSKIYPIAYYTDTPAELLFNTPEAIYLLDGRGELASTFPLHLQSPATTGLLLTDFSGQGDYGIFIACENGRLYGFDRYGRPLEGWGPGPEVGIVTFPLQHFQYDNKDYLIAYTQDGLLHVFQRDGNYRFPPVEVPPQLISAPGTQVLSNMARIAIGDGLGRVQIINGEGNGFTMATSAGNNERVKFCFEDVVGDERKDYIVLSGKEVAVYFYDGDKVKRWKKISLPNHQDELVSGPVFGEEKAFFGTLDRKKKQIFLFTSDGKLQPGFPLAGTSAFSIDRIPEGKLLVTALGSDVYGYLLVE